MKKIFFLILLGSTSAIGQVLSNQPVVNQITDQNPFLDASTSFNGPGSIGKGLVFPQTDLTTWTFDTSGLDGINFPSAFDGMIVYNTASGSTLENQGQIVSVTPGFYYFSNPGATDNITNGQWIKFEAGVAGGKFVDGTNSADAVYTNGNVGIGTLTPDAKLSIKSSGSDQTTKAIDIINSNDSNLFSITSDGVSVFNGINSAINAMSTFYAKTGQSYLTVLSDGSTPIAGVVVGGIDNSVLGLKNATNNQQYNFFNSTSLDGIGIFDVTNLGSARFFIKNTTGKIGFGTVDPLEALDIVDRSGNDAVINLFKFNVARFGMKVGGSTPAESYLGLGIRSGNYSTLNITQNRNVGIGTITPRARLEVNGYVMLGSADTVGDATPQEGMLRFNTVTKKFQGYDGTSWVDLN
jgi:hypothetical protein